MWYIFRVLTTFTAPCCLACLRGCDQLVCLHDFRWKQQFLIRFSLVTVRDCCVIIRDQ